MKLKVLATGNAPTHYSFSGDVVTAHYGDQSEPFDLSALAIGDKFEGVEADVLEMNNDQIIRDVYRDDTGELYVTICQRVGPGHWTESEWMPVSAYGPKKINVTFLDTAVGVPFAVTKDGVKEVRDGQRKKG